MADQPKSNRPTDNRFIYTSTTEKRGQASANPEGTKGIRPPDPKGSGGSSGGDKKK